MTGEPQDLWVAMNDEPETGLNLLQKGLQRALAARGVMPVHCQRSAAARRVARLMGKLGLVRPVWRRPPRVVVPVTWASEATLFPASCFHEVVPFIFDCWPEQFDRWAKLLQRHRVRLAFFTARDAIAAMQRRLPALDARWLPEACDPSKFHPGTPLAERTLHVLEMGRKHAPVHDALRGGLQGFRHVFSVKDSSTPIFAGLDDLYRAMGDTVVSICHPRSVTHHADATERVETMTQRYLETIGSGALAVGQSPAELRDLFGFDPVIELSRVDPAGHVRDILRDARGYQAHADCCLARLAEVGTFEARADTLIRSCNDAG
ncbi:MAG: hypothetical protein WCK33_11230 [Phycisphaerae bacterium]|jgi:hypothetical protein